MKSKSILLVEDEKLHRLTLQDNLEDAGYRVSCAETGQEALDLLGQQFYPVALLDIRLPDLSGIELLHELRNRQPDCCVILMTGQSSVEAAVAAMRAGAYDYLPKPFKVDLLLLRIERAFQLQALRQQLTECNAGQSLTSHSPLFQKVMQSCKTAAATQATILLLGESGVGKELLADYIHRNSPRADAPLIRVNCAAIPETLLESELFGYCQGAFSGAQRDHDGLLLQADGGTLFLDEIGEIPLPMQVKLLRVLQERKLRRIGDENELAANFRLIAATHQDLVKLVKQGRIREDFYYRLNVIPLHVPPLRERREDLIPLVAQLVGQIAGRYRQPPIRLAPESMKLLEQYRFPGNVRELRNMLERLQVLCPGETIRPAQLPAEMRERGSGSGSGSELVQGFRTDQGLRQAMQQFEARFIQRVLEEEGGNRTAAARRLSISRKNLWEKLREVTDAT